MPTRRLETFGAALAASALVLGSLLAVSSASAAAQTVTAADFDDGTYGGWTQSGGGGGGTLSLVDADSGRVLQVADRDADYVGIQSPTGIFEPATTYQLSMWARV